MSAMTVPKDVARGKYKQSGVSADICLGGTSLMAGSAEGHRWHQRFVQLHAISLSILRPYFSRTVPKWDIRGSHPQGQVWT